MNYYHLPQLFYAKFVISTDKQYLTAVNVAVFNLNLPAGTHYYIH